MLPITIILSRALPCGEKKNVVWRIYIHGLGNEESVFQTGKPDEKFKLKNRYHKWAVNFVTRFKLLFNVRIKNVYTLTTNVNPSV